MVCEVPSLVDLCVQIAIDNIRYLGNVGETDSYLLERILPHCTLDQLIHIENCTEDRDLSPITDKLWKRFYEKNFGAESTNRVVERMRQARVTFKWRKLYEAKLEDREREMQNSLDRLKKRYQEEDARKQSRQVRLCTKVPPSSRKRTFFGGAVASNIYNTKSNLLKKAKLDFVNSREVKNLAAMKNKVVHHNHRIEVKDRSPMKNKIVQRNQSVFPPGKQIASSGLASSSSSSSKLARPMEKGFRGKM